jgi:hypothetical protein
MAFYASWRVAPLSNYYLELLHLRSSLHGSQLRRPVSAEKVFDLYFREPMLSTSILQQVVGWLGMQAPYSNPERQHEKHG